MKIGDRPILAIGVLVAVALLLVGTPPILQSWAAVTETSQDIWIGLSEIARNIGLIVIAPFALWLAWRRTNTASKQAVISERGLQIDRYQKGALMLESDKLSARIAGIFALRELALSDPKPSYILVLDLLYAFVRENSKDRQPLVTKSRHGIDDEVHYGEYGPLPADLAEALRAATHLRNTVDPAFTGVEEDNWRPNLRATNLSSAELFGENLSTANLSFANLSSTLLFNVNLSSAHLFKTNLSRARFRMVNLSDANLYGFELNHAKVFDYVWAYEDARPENAQDEILNAMYFRKRDEDRGDFQVRMDREKVARGEAED